MDANIIDYYINRAKNCQFQPLSHPPLSYFYLALRFACSDGNVNAIDQMLKDSRFEYSIRTENLIFYSIMYERIEVINRLIQDPRIDPSLDNNYSIRWASQYGHLEVVKLLLEDKRVDPAAHDNYAIRWASRNDHLEVVKILLHDKRVRDLCIKKNQLKNEVIKLKKKYKGLIKTLLQTPILPEYIVIIISLLIDYTQEEIVALIKKGLSIRRN
jgi:ankyrin repeat protein